MPEAVIVATARSPIGRAAKGTMTGLPPRRPGRHDRAGRAGQGARSSTRPTIDDLMLGCGLPGGEQGFNMARVVAVLLGHDQLPGTTVTRYCSSSLQTIRMAFHAIKAGEGDVFVAAGVETRQPVREGQLRRLAGHPQPGLRRAPRQRSRRPPQGGVEWHDPRADGDGPRHLHRHGPDRGEPGPGSRASPARRWTSSASARRTWPRRRSRTASGQREITPVTRPDGTVVSKDDGPRPGVTMEGVAGLKPVFRPDGRVTAGNCCPLNDGAAAVVVMCDTRAARARHHAAGPDRVDRGVRRCRRRSWASARSRRRSRRSPGPA